MSAQPGIGFFGMLRGLNYKRNLPRNLFTDTLRPDLRRWNDSGVPQVGTAGPASEFALKKETVRLNAPEEEHVAPLEGIPTVTLLEGLIRQETL
jgi:hypothetical protein